MTTVRAAVFASGTGSNFQAIVEHKELACEIVLLICDQPGAAVIEKASAFGIPTFVFDPKAYASKTAYEQEIAEKLDNSNVEWIFLAGYMRIVGQTLLNEYEGRIINIHPSLLPAFPGKDAIGQALRARVKTTGVTVHYIDEGIDTGPIIAQETVDIFPEDTLSSVQKRIQTIEHRLFPVVINQVIKKSKLKM